MTTLAAYLTPPSKVSLTALKAYLGVTTIVEDTRLTRWYTTAIEWCDQVLSSRDFTADPPVQVVTAVYEYVRAFRDIVNLAGIGGSATGIKKVKTGAREEEYFGGNFGHSAVSAAQNAAWPHLEKWCEDPTLFASGGVAF